MSMDNRQLTTDRHGLRSRSVLRGVRLQDRVGTVCRRIESRLDVGGRAAHDGADRIAQRRERIAYARDGRREDGVLLPP